MLAAISEFWSLHTALAFPLSYCCILNKHASEQRPMGEPFFQPTGPECSCWELPIPPLSAASHSHAHLPGNTGNTLPSAPAPETLILSSTTALAKSQHNLLPLLPLWWVLLILPGASPYRLLVAQLILGACVSLQSWGVHSDWPCAVMALHLALANLMGDSLGTGSSAHSSASPALPGCGTTRGR